MKYQPYLTTLDEVRRLQQLNDDAVEDSDDINNQLIDYIDEASRQMVSALQRIPIPFYDTRLFDYGGNETVTRRELLLDDDLLEVDTLTNITAFTASQFVLRPSNTYPKYNVKLKRSSNRVWEYEDDPEEAISITGWWGYVPHYEEAWRDSGETMPAGDTASSTTITLTGTGLGFERYQYLKVNDEILLLTDITEATDTTLTVRRGELGTTAAAHNSGDTITTYYPVQDIQGATTELARYFYKTKNDLGGNIQVFEGGVLTVRDVDKRVGRAISNHRRYVGGVV